MQEKDNHTTLLSKECQCNKDCWCTVTGHCIVLYCVVLHCIVLYCIVLHCIVFIHLCSASCSAPIRRETILCFTSYVPILKYIRCWSGSQCNNYKRFSKVFVYSAPSSQLSYDKSALPSHFKTGRQRRGLVASLRMPKQRKWNVHTCMFFSFFEKIYSSECVALRGCVSNN